VFLKPSTLVNVSIFEVGLSAYVFGMGVVIDYSVRMEQFQLFTEAFTVKRLKSYVTMKLCIYSSPVHQFNMAILHDLIHDGFT
jgi:hypothetical protein